MRKFLIFFLALIVSVRAMAFDFSAICSTGQTLYFSITDETDRKVKLTFPGPSIDSAYKNFDMPAGSLSIPSNVSYNGITYLIDAIDACAFAKCNNLTGTLEIPSTITFIGNSAFLHCGHVEELHFKAANCASAFSAFEGCRFETIVLDGVVTNIPEAIFANNTYLKLVKVNRNLRQIGKRAFYNCPNLESVVGENNIQIVGDYAFYDCRSLREISLRNVESFGCMSFANTKIEALKLCGKDCDFKEMAFMNCKNLKSVVLDTCFYSMSQFSFYFCDEIETISCLAIVPPEMTENAFSNYEAELLVPCQSVEEYRNALGWRQFQNIRPLVAYNMEVSSSNVYAGYVRGPENPLCFGHEATIEAFPYEHYSFVEWNDGDTINPRNVTIQSDTVFVANFQLILDTSDLYSQKEPVVVSVNGNCVRVIAEQKHFINVYRVTGQCVFSSSCEIDSVCVTLLQNGVYLVKVGDSLCKKIVINV